MKAYWWKIVNWWGTTKHRLWVLWYMLKVCWVLIRRALRHDLSKYSRQEAPYFEEVLLMLRGLEYGSGEYQAALGQLGPALQHHYQSNRHHPEHFYTGIGEMTSLDLLEMVCDWKAAGRRHATGNFDKSLTVNADRFAMTPAIYASLVRDSREIGLTSRTE